MLFIDKSIYILCLELIHFFFNTAQQFISAIVHVTIHQNNCSYMRFRYDSYFRYVYKSYYMLRRTIVQELHIQIFILSSSSVSNGISYCYCFVSFLSIIRILRLQRKTLLLSYCFFFTIFLVKHFNVVCHSLKFQPSIYTHFQRIPRDQTSDPLQFLLVLSCHNTTIKWFVLFFNQLHWFQTK